MGVPGTDENRLQHHEILAKVISDVCKERVRQERLKREGRFKHTPSDWDCSDEHKLAILVEEVGETSREVMKNPTRPEEVVILYKELIQVAAIAMAWAESCIPNFTRVESHHGEGA